MEKEQTPTDQANNSNEIESLEAQTTVVESGNENSPTTTENGVPQNADQSGVTTPAEPVKKKKGGYNPIKGLAGKLNIYLLMFVFVLIIAGGVTAVSILKQQQENDQSQQLVTEPLSEEALEQLRQTDVKVGDPKQVLSVESNAIFAGRVLVRSGLEVAGEIKAGAPLNLPGITVTGTSILNQVQANTIQVGNNATIQGQLAVQDNLTVAGSGSFGGTLTAGRLNIQDLQINGTLQFTGHLDAGGSTPGRTNGGALGAGGTSSISGSDTAGTVAINTGGGPAAGCFVNVTFSQRYNSVPHVVVTPVGPAAGNLNFYINRNQAGFSICTANNPAGGQSFAFDYLVIE